MSIKETVRSIKDDIRAARRHGVNSENSLRWVLRNLKLAELKASPLPILTASVIGTLNEKIDEFPLVMSRAHLSQPVAFSQAFESQLPIADVANYLEDASQREMINTAINGRIASRSPALSTTYKYLTPILRKLLPVNKGFRDVCAVFAEELVKNEGRPIVTFHYGVGNSLIETLKRKKIKTTPIVHYVTDPYVHNDYLRFKDQPFVYFFVFNEDTKKALEKKGVKKEKIFVTGFPLNKNLDINLNDPKKAEEYKLGSGGKLRISIFTGGTGTNQDEIVEIAKNLDYSRQAPVFYCGTNYDLAEKLKKTFEEKRIGPFTISDNLDNLQIDPDSQATVVVGRDLSKLLPISYQIINWSQIVATKPSGDIGIESLAAGKPTVVLKEWGQQEVNIRRIIRQYNGEIEIPGGLKNIGRELNWLKVGDKLYSQVMSMWKRLKEEPPFPLNWIENVKQVLKLL